MIKGLYISVSLFILQFAVNPFVQAENSHHDNSMTVTECTPDRKELPADYSFASLYDSLQLELSGLSREAFDLALRGREKLLGDGLLQNDSVIAIVDFSQPSSRKRLYILDLFHSQMLFNTLVAHGRNSGTEIATHFSNRPSSYQSSPGLYVTGLVYQGSNGYSLKLQGVEKGINDKAMQRAIVMHGAPYVNESFIAARGYLGRSMGCPAVPVAEARSIINTLRDGACLYIYTPDKKYSSRSVLLKDFSEDS